MMTEYGPKEDDTLACAQASEW